MYSLLVWFVYSTLISSLSAEWSLTRGVAYKRGDPIGTYISGSLWK